MHVSSSIQPTVWLLADFPSVDAAGGAIRGLLASRARLRVWESQHKLLNALESAATPPAAVALWAGAAFDPRQLAELSAPCMSRGASLALLLGPWCEGALVKHRLSASVAAIPWHDPARLLRWLAQLAGPSGADAIPPERIGVRRTPALARAGLVLLAGWRREEGETLADACASLGQVAVLESPSMRLVSTPPAAVLWRVPRESERALKQLAELRRRHAAARIVAAADFLRPDQIDTLRTAGADEVLRWPASLEQLSSLFFSPASRELAPSLRAA